jgi:hypothetical protein
VDTVLLHLTRLSVAVLRRTINLGRALDLDQDGHGNGVTNADVFNYIKSNLDFDQLIWEFGTDKNPDWVHVGYRKGANRKQVLEGCIVRVTARQNT